MFGVVMARSEHARRVVVVAAVRPRAGAKAGIGGDGRLRHHIGYKEIGLRRELRRGGAGQDTRVDDGRPPRQPVADGGEGGGADGLAPREPSTKARDCGWPHSGGQLSQR